MEPTPELTCPNCNDDYIEYESSIALSEPQQPVVTIHMGPGRMFHIAGTPAMDILNDFLRNFGQGHEGGEHPIRNWITNIFRRVADLGNTTGRTLGDYFLGTEEQLGELAERLMRLNQQSLGSPPTDRKFIDTLKPVPYTEGSCVESTCFVCFDEFQEGKDVIILPCRHGFHKECIEPWLQMHSECPCCRAKLPSV